MINIPNPPLTQDPQDPDPDLRPRSPIPTFDPDPQDPTKKDRAVADRWGTLSQNGYGDLSDPTRRIRLSAKASTELIN
jgi:hypothetical protein